MFRTLARVAVALCIIAIGGWAVLALLHAGAGAGVLRRLLAAGLACLTVACAAALVLGRGWRILPGAPVAGSVAVLGWFAALQPSNDRDWLPDVARAPWAEVEGGTVTVHNVRYFGWRSEADFAERWETRSVDLDRLQGVDLLASYWMGEAIAHVMVSFVFAGAPPLAVSIETRKERGEPYSTVLGFFRRYELVYVIADERDLVGVRTNVRADPPEEVRLYRTAMRPDAARRLFLEYVRQMNELRERPRFYNTATTNCTTMILVNNRVNGPVSLLNWKVLLSGYLPQLAYEHGGLDRTMPFPELRRRSVVNAAARDAGIEAPDFSARIRAGLPTSPAR